MEAVLSRRFSLNGSSSSMDLEPRPVKEDTMKVVKSIPLLLKKERSLRLDEILRDATDLSTCPKEEEGSSSKEDSINSLCKVFDNEGSLSESKLLQGGDHSAISLRLSSQLSETFLVTDDDTDNVTVSKNVKSQSPLNSLQSVVTKPHDDVMSRTSKWSRMSASSTSSTTSSSATTTSSLDDVRLRDSHLERWNQRFEELKEFRRQQGHCCVPLDYPQNPTLAHW